MALHGKVAIISGGSRGIGRAAVEALAEKDAKVAFTYHNESEEIEKIVNEYSKYPGQIRAYQVNSKDHTQIKMMVASVIKEWGTIDIVINNAGIRKDKTLAFMGYEDWNDVLQTNLTGAFSLTQASIFYMLKKRSGRVINISSISGINGIAGQTNYSSSKAALIGFTKALAKEVGQYGISINAIAPGGIETDMTKNLSDSDKTKLIQGVPLGRMGKIDEVIKVMMFLADDDASPEYLTGVVIPLDGGMGL
ncbi:MAG: 3-oxoacyl-ACP reductase family protein [Bacillota bacterium]